MQATTWADWSSCAEVAYNELASRCEKVVVAGLSMGGTLAVWLAAHHPEIAGVVAINAAIDPPAESFRQMMRQLLADGHTTMPAVGNDVAEHPGEIFLEIPDEVAEKIVDRARQIRRAFDFNVLSRGFVACKQERQGARVELHDERARGFCLRPLEKAVAGDREAQVWKRRAAKFHGLARKGSQALGRPRLLLQKMVQGCEGAALDHGGIP